VRRLAAPGRPLGSTSTTTSRSSDYESAQTAAREAGRFVVVVGTERRHGRSPRACARSWRRGGAPFWVVDPAPTSFSALSRGQPPRPLPARHRLRVVPAMVDTLTRHWLTLPRRAAMSPRRPVRRPVPGSERPSGTRRLASPIAPARGPPICAPAHAAPSANWPSASRQPPAAQLEPPVPPTPNLAAAANPSPRAARPPADSPTLLPLRLKPEQASPKRNGGLPSGWPGSCPSQPPWGELVTCVWCPPAAGPYPLYSSSESWFVLRISKPRLAGRRKPR
jgi:hypothetical protein